MRRNAAMPVITIAMSTAVLLTGCGGNEKEVSFNSGGVTHTFSEANAQATKNFALPLYPNAKAEGVNTAKGAADEASGYMILKTPDKIEAVTSFYAEKLKAEGWTIDSNTSMPQLANISVSKNDLEGNVLLGVDEQSKETTITLAFNKEASGAAATSTGKDAQSYTPDKLNPPTD